TLSSGSPVLDAGGVAIDRPTFEDVVGQTVGAGEVWRVEQMFSPQTRESAVEHRANAPYLGSVVDGRFVVTDYGIENPDGSWRLASGTAIVDAGGAPVAAPTVADIVAMPHAEGEEWRLEEIGFNPYAGVPVDLMGVYFIDGKVVDYSVEVTDADGTFAVWARNLDRALELQHKLGYPGEFNLRNYEVDFATLDEVNSTDDSAYRVELMTAGQLHFATSIYGIDFQPDIMAAATDPDTGVISYSPGSFTGQEASTVDENGDYVSFIDTAIDLFDAMMQVYIGVSRAFAVRVALQGGLADFAAGLEYVADSDEFRPATDLELAPVFDAIFAATPSGAQAAYDYLAGWQEILEVVYPDYHLDPSKNLLSNTVRLNEAFVLQNVIAGFEKYPPDLDLAGVMNALKLDDTKLVTHTEADTVVVGTDGDDYIYLTGGDQTYRGGHGKDVYFVGSGFGHDVIDDVEEALVAKAQVDELRFTSAKSTDIYATADGLDLVREVIGTDDVLRIKDQFLGDLIDPLFGNNFANDTGVHAIVFADGELWSWYQIAEAVSHPLDTDDLVLGTESRDFLAGGLGNDVLRGGRDGDIYAYHVGDGDDRIADNNDRPTDDPTKHLDLLQVFGDATADSL
ncbi:MAG TPA: hypothetical protein PLG99_13085, partial [Kaistiaceae bacterium]|nr:hypothetical protein [Kaistiaceae bacterium]